MTIDIDLSKKIATPWNEIPNGVFKAKLFPDEIYAMCVWFKFGEDFMMIRNLSFDMNINTHPTKQVPPSQMFFVEPIQFKGV
jgi:hypothetical protein